MRPGSVLGLVLCVTGCSADVESRYPDRGDETASVGGTGPGGGDMGSAAAGGSESAGGVGTGGSGGSRSAPLDAAVAGPNPRIGVRARVAASAGVSNPERLVDDEFHSGTATVFGQPTPAAPASVAIEVGAGPTRLLAVWKDAGWNQYTSNLEGAPLDYHIDVSADSTDGVNGTWQQVVDVEANPVNNRGHSFDFTGKSWLRFVVTAAPAGSMGANRAAGVVLDELSLYDLSSTPTGPAPDSWFFFGDSITQLAYRRDIGSANMFDAQVAATHSAYFPAMLNGGVGGDDLVKALARIDQALELNPDFRYFAIAFGTNDAWGNQSPVAKNFEGQLRQLITKIEAAGRVPVLARIPSSTHEENGAPAFTTLPDFNAIIDKLQAELGLPAGPDMFQVISDTPASLGEDGVHPVTPGSIAMNRAWANAVAPLYAPAP